MVLWAVPGMTRNTPGDPAIVRPAYLLKDYIVADFANDDQLLLAIEMERNIKIKEL
jgi:hypothetical protein